MLVYMDRPEQAYQWPGTSSAVTRELSDLGHLVYRPDRAYVRPQQDPKDRNDEALTQCARFEITRAALRAADGGVAYVIGGGSDLDEMVSRVDALTAHDVPTLVITDLAAQHELMSGWAANPRVVVIGTDPDQIGEGVLGLNVLMLRRRAEALQPQASAGQTQALWPGRAAQALLPLIFEPVGTCPDVAVHEGDGVMGFRSLLPPRGYHDDAGFDLVVSEDTKIPAGQFVDVPCGVRVDLPEGTWGMIVGRSSTLRRRQLLVNTGVIDAGWTGPLFAGVQNLGQHDVVVPAGDRLAQLIVLPAPAVGLRPAWGQVRTDKSRGESGFGSTGV